MSAAAGIGNIVVVGANIAGASAVEALRREGYDGHLVLVGAETELPYERPPLSKEVLLGTKPPEQVHLRDAAFYQEQRVELLLGTRAVALDAATRLVELDGGQTLPFDRLLIATGGEARRLSVPGAELAGISYLRTLPEARALVAQLGAVASAGGRVAIVGAGFIGCEVAAACRALGIEVTVIEALAAPMERVLGGELGARLAEVHRAHGVELHLDEGVAAFHGAAGRVEAVETTGGARVACAAVVVGIGVRPAMDWLEGSGVALGDGVLVDAFCETTLSGIFAAGDVANWPYAPPGGGNSERVRLEHWDNALRQGEAAARNMLGRRIPFTPVPYFWSDQYDLKLQYVGYARTWDDVVYRGDPTSSSYAAFYLAEGQIRAALSVNRVRDLVPLKKLIGKRLDSALLADESADLRTLAR